MLYTTYLSNVKNLPDNEDVVKILITRFRPTSTFKPEKYNLIWRPPLAPSEHLFARYKEGTMSWSEFRETYIEQASTSKEFEKSFYEIKKYIEEGKDVFLICYEKDDMQCHRSILREIFNCNGIECIEYK